MNKRLLLQFKNIRSPNHRSEKILLSTIGVLKKEYSNPQNALLTAINNLSPGVKVLTQIRAGKVFSLPAYQSEQSAHYFAIKWLFKAVQDKRKRSFVMADLVNELKDTLNYRGLAFRSKVRQIKLIKEARVNLRKSFKRYKYKSRLKLASYRVFRKKVATKVIVSNVTGKRRISCRLPPKISSRLLIIRYRQYRRNVQIKIDSIKAEKKRERELQKEDKGNMRNKKTKEKLHKQTTENKKTNKKLYKQTTENKKT